MSVQTPERYWWKPIHKAERVWIGLALTWCLVLFIVMPMQHFFGKQNSTGEAYRVDPQAYMQFVLKWTDERKSGDVNGVPVVAVAPGSDAYLLAQMWRFYPILKLKKGESYRLHVSSPDLQHGLSIQPMNMNFQILPGYDHVLTITPTQAGEYSVICNEFCGIGHHLMTGKIIVEE